jgi:hypothetical protein
MRVFVELEGFAIGQRLGIKRCDARVGEAQKVLVSRDFEL